MTNETVLNDGQGAGKDATRTWAVALKEAASFVKEQAFTFGGKLITPPHERLEFKIGVKPTFSEIYTEKSGAYTTVSLKIEELEGKIKGLNELLKVEQSNTDEQVDNTDEQVDEKKSLPDANNELKTAKSSLNKSKISLWFIAFLYTVVKTPKYLYNLGNNVVNLFLRALGFVISVVINACAFALYAVSYIVLQLRMLGASVMKSDTKDMRKAWDTANEKTSYAAVVYAYLTYKMPSENVGSGEKPGDKPIAAKNLTNAATPVKLHSKKSKNNSDLIKTAGEGEGHSNTPGINPTK